MYLQALKCVLASEFPYPTEEMIRKATPEAFKRHFPGRSIQEIIDAHEIEVGGPGYLPFAHHRLCSAESILSRTTPPPTVEKKGNVCVCVGGGGHVYVRVCVCVRARVADL